MTRLIFPIDSAHAKRLAKAVGQGDIERFRAKVYTDANWEDIPQLVHNR